ncbi:hypothetical protein T09_2131 [Trichinella sp. T9]|nr:hypothetical protein T09_2131 [Trichinella sp. T9]
MDIQSKQCYLHHVPVTARQRKHRYKKEMFAEFLQEVAQLNPGKEAAMVFRLGDILAVTCQQIAGMRRFFLFISVLMRSGGKSLQKQKKTFFNFESCWSRSGVLC